MGYRKTNLFYRDGADSKFLTFSNYAEHLTSAYVDVNKKIFPSKFLCIKFSTEINEDKKENLINILTGYYENKMAVLLDTLISDDKKPEDYLYPLSYLLTALYKIDSNFTIEYIGEISEQDYNGVFTDSICVINTENCLKGELVLLTDKEKNDLINTNKNIIGLGESKLHGWDTDDTYNINPYFDNGSQYTVLPEYSKIITSTNTVDNIEFDIIIPLYDIVDINYSTNIYNDANLVINIGDTENNNNYYKDIPYGIWIADNRITLPRDVQNNACASWSLVISSQFKPFPYSDKMNTELSNNNIRDAYATFSQILIQQNELTEKFQKLIQTNANLTNKINELTLIVNKLDTASKNIGTMESDINSLKSSINQIKGLLEN